MSGEKTELQFSDFPFSSWLENIIKEMFNIKPVAIALEMLDEGGQVYTCYWNTSPDDRSRMMGGMEDDNRMAWVMANRDEIAQILSDDYEDEEEGEDG